MSTAVAQMSLEVLGAGPHIAPVRLPHQIIPDDPEPGFDRAREREVDRLIENLEGKDAASRLHPSKAPAPLEKQIHIDIPSLQAKLSSCLPGDRQLERRARKLAWYLAKGRRVRYDWDNVSLSELTPTEKRMSDEDFLVLYPDHIPTRKGGRPKKYRSAAAQRRGHAERQRRYRERKSQLVPNVTKTTSQLAEK